MQVLGCTAKKLLTAKLILDFPKTSTEMMKGLTFKSVCTIGFYPLRIR